MIEAFLKDRKSWILLVLFIQALMIFTSFIDPSIPLRPILYIMFLSMVIFVYFLIIRYQKETKFYKGLLERDTSLDETSVPTPFSSFEQIVHKTITDQADVLKQELSINQTNFEQEKDQLLAWIHEVKTPLTAMHLMIERIEDEKLKAQLTYEWLRIHLLLDQQLHQKRISFIENDLYIENIDLYTIIHQEIKTLQSWCIQKGVGFDIQLEVETVDSEVKWLGFIIRQLLSNAVKYSEGTDIAIRSFLKNGQVSLEIKDTGRGIDSKDMPRIFDKGFTSSTNHDNQASTGMGLYLVKEATKSLLITIDVESKLKAGTTFTLLFPKRNEFANITSM